MAVNSNEVQYSNAGAPNQGRSAKRTDIQVLRGIAVLLVVLYHAGPGGFAGGYLGVDMFFVVSGYLITGLITRAIDDSRFSPIEFYIRRAKRLLPAALTVFLLTAIGAEYLLTQEELHSFVQQLFGSVFAVGNIVLWLQSGYFDTASQMKPLLHTWSLGIEEQFYLITPWLLLLIAPRSRLLLLTAGTLCSFALWLIVSENLPEAAFYLLPTRAWELGIGAIGSCLPMLRRSRRNTALSALALLAIISISLHPLERFDAPLVCLATLWLLLSAPPFLNGTAIWPLVRIGDISYSLYLVHWPLLAFAHSYYAGDSVPPRVILALVAAAFAGATLLHVAIEVPCRRAVFRLPHRGASALILLPLCLPLLAQAAVPAVADWQMERRPNHGLGKICELDGPFQTHPECSVGKTPKILVWGDSIAMLWPVALTNAGVVQATMSTCGPMLGIAPFYATGNINPAWAQRCIVFNDSVLTWLKTQPQISHVLLSSRFTYDIEPGRQLLTRNGTQPQGIGVATRALAETVTAIRAMGKKVVIMEPPPLATFDVGICLEREATGKPIGGRSNCEIETATYRATDAGVLELLRRVQQDTKVTVLRPAELLCDAKSCKTTLDGVPLYRDKEHFSYRGADKFAQSFELEKKILAQ